MLRQRFFLSRVNETLAHKKNLSPFYHRSLNYNAHSNLHFCFSKYKQQIIKHSEDFLISLSINTGKKVTVMKQEQRPRKNWFSSRHKTEPSLVLWAHAESLDKAYSVMSVITLH